MLVPFAPPPGLNSDDTTFKAEGRWVDGNNVRFRNGAPEVIGAFKALFAGTLTGSCTNIFAFNRSGTVTIAYATDAKLYVGTGTATPSDRTPTGLGTIYNWSLAEWGSTLLAVPGDGKLYEQAGASTATEVVNAPDRITCMLVTPQRQVLALGCNEEGSGTFNPLCIRGSDLEDYTDWTTTSTNNAFEHILDGPGQIVAARMVGPYVAVWTTAHLYLGQYLGDPGQTYRFDRITEIPGPIGSNAVTTHKGIAYWLGADMSVWQWTPGAIPAKIPCPVSRELRSARPPALSNRNRVTMHPISAFDEIWMHNLFVDGDGGGYFAFNVETLAWFKGAQFNRLGALDSAAIANITSDGSMTLMAGLSLGNSTIYEHEARLGDLGPSAFRIVSGDQYIDNSQRRMMIRGYRPDHTFMPGGYDLTLFVRNTQESAAVTKGPYSISGSLEKKDFRASGKIVAVKMSSDIGGPYVGGISFGKSLFDIVPLGKR